MLRSRWLASEELLCCMGLVHDDVGHDYDENAGNWWHCVCLCVCVCVFVCVCGCVMFLFLIFGLCAWEDSIIVSALTVLSAAIIYEWWTAKPVDGIDRDTAAMWEVCIKFWWGNLRKRDHWGDPGVDRRIKLRLIFRKWDVGGMGWLRIETGGGRLWMR
jgi:hypothetical protein